MSVKVENGECGTMGGKADARCSRVSSSMGFHSDDKLKVQNFIPAKP